MSTTQDTSSARRRLAHDLRTLADAFDRESFNEFPTPIGTARFARHLRDATLFLELTNRADDLEISRASDGIYLSVINRFGEHIEVRWQVLLHEIRDSLTDHERDQLARLFPELAVTPLQQAA